MDRRHELIQEANYLHSRLFAKPAPMEISRLYVKVHDHYFRDENIAEREVLKKMRSLNLPLEPLEFACRGHCPIIARKVGAMIYLVEAFSGYEENFGTQRRSFPRVLAVMVWSFTRAPWVWGRGWIIAKFHGII
jgi:hypothetical protein